MSLRDGTTWLVPRSVNVPSAVFEGSQVSGTYQRIGNENVMTFLDVLPRAEPLD